MSYTLQQGLEDLSTILNESTTQTSTARKNHYNEAVQEFCNERKWPFTIKKHTDTTVADQADYDLPSDIREPGGLIEVLIGNQEYKPIPFNDRLDSKYSSGYYYCVYPENDNRKIKFIPTPSSSGDTITIRYFSVPSRVTDLNGTLDIPDRYRRPIALLAAEFVSRAKRQHATANNFRVLYDRAIEKITVQQAERHKKLPRTFGHYLKYIGFKRTYP